jgi:hypothetical protein
MAARCARIARKCSKVEADAQPNIRLGLDTDIIWTGKKLSGITPDGLDQAATATQYLAISNSAHRLDHPTDVPLELLLAFVLYRTVPLIGRSGLSGNAPVRMRLKRRISRQRRRCIKYLDVRGRPFRVIGHA